MFKIIIAPKAQKQLKKLKKNYEIALSQVIDEIREDPEIGKVLKEDLTGRYSYKVGVLRIIYKINLSDKTVLIISAGHRSVVYN